MRPIAFFYRPQAPCSSCLKKSACSVCDRLVKGTRSIVTVAGIFELGVRQIDSQFVYPDLKQT